MFGNINIFKSDFFFKCFHLKPGEVDKGLWDVEDVNDDDDDDDDDNDDDDGEDGEVDESIEEYDVVLYPVVVVTLDVVAVVFREKIPDVVVDVVVVVVVVVVLSWKRNESAVELSWLTNCINRT